MASFIVDFIVEFLLALRKFVEELVGRRAFVDGRNQKAILITGCDCGFGRKTALELYRKGFNVFAACLTEAGKKSIVEESVKWRGENGHKKAEFISFLLNVASPSDVAKGLEFVRSKLPPNRGLWALINNAGVAARSLPSAWLNIADYERVMEVNFFGSILMSQAFEPLLAKERGRLICIISFIGFKGIHSTSAYCSSKFAVKSFVQTTAKRLRGGDVTVISIMPGYHNTGMVDTERAWKELNDGWQRLPKEVQEDYPKEFIEKRKTFVPRYVDFMGSNNSIQNVVNALVDAAASCKPLHAYWIGYDAFVIRWFVQHFPNTVKLSFCIYAKLRLYDFWWKRSMRAGQDRTL